MDAEAEEKKPRVAELDCEDMVGQGGRVELQGRGGGELDREGGSVKGAGGSEWGRGVWAGWKGKRGGGGRKWERGMMP